MALSDVIRKYPLPSATAITPSKTGRAEPVLIVIRGYLRRSQTSGLLLTYHYGR